MSAASDYLENKLLDHSLATTTFTAPGAVYVGLHTGSPGDADDGANEVSGGSYARQSATVPLSHESPRSFDRTAQVKVGHQG